MVGKTLDLKHVSEAILGLLKEEFDLEPKVISVGMVLARDDFNIVADNHPNAVLSNLLQASETTDDRRLQWSVQIRPEITFEDFPPDVQKRLKPPPD